MQKKQTRISKTVESQDIKKNMVQVNNKFDDHVSTHHFDSSLWFKNTAKRKKGHVQVSLYQTKWVSQSFGWM